MDPDVVALHGRLDVTRRRWDRAAQMVARHTQTHPDSYVAWSGGKDSTVVADLAHRQQPGIPIVRCTHGVDYPETVAYCAEVAQRLGWRYVVADCGDPDAYLRSISATDETSNGSYLADVTRALGRDVDGWLYGLRSDESPQRRVHLASRRGAWTTPAGRMVTAPIWQWSTLDAHAYLADRGIPLNPVYRRLAELGAPERSQRVGFLAGGAGARAGRYVWLRLGWPAEWERLAERVAWLRAVS